MCLAMVLSLSTCNTLLKSYEVLDWNTMHNFILCKTVEVLGICVAESTMPEHSIVFRNLGEQTSNLLGNVGVHINDVGIPFPL